MAANETTICPSCGTGNDATDRFCAECGTPLTRACTVLRREPAAGREVLPRVRDGGRERRCGGGGAARDGAGVRARRPGARDREPARA